MKLIDLHCDTIDLIMNNNQSLKSNSLCVDIEKLKMANSLCQTFALFVDLKTVNSPYEHCMRMYETFLKEINLNKSDISLAKNYNDIIKNKEDNKISALLSIEEGAVLEGDIKKLKKFYDLGVRIITLTWNYENELGYPNFFEETKDKGLKNFGIEVVEKMNELGILIDVSHLSDGGFYDVLKYSKKPFIATHSNSRTITNHKRNLTDDMIKKLSNCGGVIGINFCSSFLNDRFDNYSRIDDIINHIKHIKNIGGIECLSIGTDFDGIDSKVEIEDISRINKLYHRLQKESFTEYDIEKIFYKNSLRVIKDVIK